MRRNEFVILSTEDDALRIYWKWSPASGSVIWGTVIPVIACMTYLVLSRNSMLSLAIMSMPLIVCFIMAYVGFACLVNSTVIQVSDTELNVHHGPIPLLGYGRRTVRIKDVRQISCQKRIYGRVNTGNGLWRRYDVFARCWDGRLRRLGGFRTATKAHQVRRLIEAHLGITNCHMPGDEPDPRETAALIDEIWRVAKTSGWLCAHCGAFGRAESGYRLIEPSVEKGLQGAVICRKCGWPQNLNIMQSGNDELTPHGELHC